MKFFFVKIIKAFKNEAAGVEIAVSIAHMKWKEQCSLILPPPTRLQF